jgi:hypothetical protein
VIEQFLGGRDRTFEDLVVPFTAVAMDVATGRAHPIRHGPLLPALLASAAVPGIYPRVDHDGRRLYDGGIVANVPMRIAVDMGARSLVVLDCAFPSQLPILGETFAEIMLFTAMVAMRTQAVYEAPLVATDVPVVYLPGPAPRPVSPLDFSHSDELIEASYEAARTFLASLTIMVPASTDRLRRDPPRAAQVRGRRPCPRRFAVVTTPETTSSSARPPNAREHLAASCSPSATDDTGLTTTRAPSSGEGGGDGGADPARRAGDEGDAPFLVAHDWWKGEATGWWPHSLIRS